MKPEDQIKKASPFGTQLAYDNELPAPSGYVLVTELTKDHDSGFKFSTYRNLANGEYMLAIAGSNDWKDVSGFGTFVFGYLGNKSQIDAAANYFEKLRILARDERVKVTVTGHSYAGLFVDLGAAHFAFQGVKFDAVGGNNVATDRLFLQSLKDKGIVPVTGGNVISVKVKGMLNGVFGGGVVGHVGTDLPGTQYCTVKTERSEANALINAGATVIAGGTGYLASKLAGGVWVHNGESIGKGVEAGGVHCPAPAAKPVPASGLAPAGKPAIAGPDPVPVAAGAPGSAPGVADGAAPGKPIAGSSSDNPLELDIAVPHFQAPRSPAQALRESLDREFAKIKDNIKDFVVNRPVGDHFKPRAAPTPPWAQHRTSEEPSQDYMILASQNQAVEGPRITPLSPFINALANKPWVPPVQFGAVSAPAAASAPNAGVLSGAALPAGCVPDSTSAATPTGSMGPGNSPGVGVTVRPPSFPFAPIVMPPFKSPFNVTFNAPWQHRATPSISPSSMPYITPLSPFVNSLADNAWRLPGFASGMQAGRALSVTPFKMPAVDSFRQARNVHGNLPWQTGAHQLVQSMARFSAAPWRGAGATIPRMYTTSPRLPLWSSSVASSLLLPPTARRFATGN